MFNLTDFKIYEQCQMHLNIGVLNTLCPYSTLFTCTASSICKNTEAKLQVEAFISSSNSGNFRGLCEIRNHDTNIPAP